MGFDPEISEWGNLVVLIRHRLFPKPLEWGSQEEARDTR